MCELLATGSSDQRPGSAFIVGLLSLLDVLLEVPMDKILSRLELSDDVRGALIGRGGPLGHPLQLVEAYERADWDTARGMAAGGPPDETIPGMYIDALHWAAQRIAS
jgi:EAL and modified HD-GYP domain-containing signal transduction protein